MKWTLEQSEENIFCVVIVLVNRVIVTLFNCDTILMMGPIRARAVETNRLLSGWPVGGRYSRQTEITRDLSITTWSLSGSSQHTTVTRDHWVTSQIKTATWTHALMTILTLRTQYCLGLDNCSDCHVLLVSFVEVFQKLRAIPSLFDGKYASVTDRIWTRSWQLRGGEMRKMISNQRQWLYNCSYCHFTHN